MRGRPRLVAGGAQDPSCGVRFRFSERNRFSRATRPCFLRDRSCGSEMAVFSCRSRTAAGSTSIIASRMGRRRKPSRRKSSLGSDNANSTTRRSSSGKAKVARAARRPVRSFPRALRCAGSSSNANDFLARSVPCSTTHQTMRQDAGVPQPTGICEGEFAERGLCPLPSAPGAEASSAAGNSKSRTKSRCEKYERAPRRRSAAKRADFAR